MTGPTALPPARPRLGPTLQAGARELWDDVRGGWRWVDGVVLALCTFLGGLFFLGRWEGMIPFVRLDGDSANIASFAAARANPKAFERDLLLSQLDDVDFYWTIQAPIARFFEGLTGDLGLAFILPTAPLIALQLFGMYVLGRVLLRSRLWGVLLAACTIPVFPIVEVGTYWGLKGLTTPRDWFAALLGFVLAATLAYRRRPGAWPALMVVMGLLMYVHPVSTPGWALAIWMGLATWAPASWSHQRRALIMVGCGLVFLATTAPFVVNYVSSSGHGPVADPALVLEAIRYRFLAGYQDVWGTTVTNYKALAGHGLLFSALFGALAVWVGDRPEDRERLAMMSAFLFGIILIANVVPVIEHDWAAANQRVPFEYDLIRGMRYVVPLLQLFTLWGIATLVRQLPARRWGMHGPAATTASSTAVACVVGLCFAFGYAEAPADVAKLPKEGWEYLKEGELRPFPEDPSRRYQALKVAKDKTPPGSTFLASRHKDALALKYFSNRPVVHNWKDGGGLIYSNQEKLLVWRKRDARFRSIRKLKGDAHLRAFAAFGKELGAEYLLLNHRVSKKAIRDLRLKVLYRSKDYTVLGLEGSRLDPPGAR